MDDIYNKGTTLTSVICHSEKVWLMRFQVTQSLALYNDVEQRIVGLYVPIKPTLRAISTQKRCFTR